MENPTPFDLNEAIRRWQQNLGASPAFKADNLEELASHLRASIQKLAATGLSEEEAFLIAMRRLGERGALEREYAKVNSSRTWVMAAFWVVLGVFVVDLRRAMESSFSILLMWNKPDPRQHAFTFFGVLSLMEYGLTALLILIAYRLAARREKGHNDFVRRCLDRPFWTIICLVGFFMLVRFLPLIVIALTAAQATAQRTVLRHSWQDWLPWAATVLWNVILAATTVVLARREFREVSPAVRSDRSQEEMPRDL
jgi:cytochrome c-type biogenesis protein CcmH/NrfF